MNTFGIPAFERAETLPPPPPSVHDFAPERVLRREQPASERGWRGIVHRVSGGKIAPQPSRAELEHRELLAAVRTPIAGCRRIAVLSRKGGIGKTTTTLMLGHTFASNRGDRVVALDANPDAGSLAYRVRRTTDATVTQLLEASESIQRYSEIRAYASQAPSRLEVIGSDNDATISVAVGEREYRRVVHTLEHHYNLILMDTGTGILDSATQGVLRMCDQIVVCAATGLDASRASSFTLDWLDEHGYDSLVRDAVVVVNQVRRQGHVSVETISEHFAKRCRAVVEVPWDPRLADGGETTLEELRPATRAAYLQAAAALAQWFVFPSRQP